VLFWFVFIASDPYLSEHPSNAAHPERVPRGGGAEGFCSLILSTDHCSPITANHSSKSFPLNPFADPYPYRINLLGERGRWSLLVEPRYRYVASTYLLYLPLLRKHPECGGILPILEPRYSPRCSCFVFIRLQLSNFTTPFFHIHACNGGNGGCLLVDQPPLTVPAASLSPPP
jgi:hypothetical protein